MIVELNSYKFKENVELNLKKKYYLMGPVILIAHSESKLMKNNKTKELWKGDYMDVTSAISFCISNPVTHPP